MFFGKYISVKKHEELLSRKQLGVSLLDSATYERDLQRLREEKYQLEAKLNAMTSDETKVCAHCGGTIYLYTPPTVSMRIASYLYNPPTQWWHVATDKRDCTFVAKPVEENTEASE